MFTQSQCAEAGSIWDGDRSVRDALVPKPGLRSDILGEEEKGEGKRGEKPN